MIAANGVRFRRNAEFKESILAAISKTMTGVYIVHYSVFHLLTALIPVTSLGMKLALIVLTFTSVLFSMLVLSNAVAKKVITFKSLSAARQRARCRCYRSGNIGELDGNALIPAENSGKMNGSGT